MNVQKHETMIEQEILLIEQTCNESQIQHTCVSWFRRTFPHVAHLLISVPNGGFRSKRSAVTMVYEGQVKGVSDLILLFPSGGKATLCIEMKTPKKKGRAAGKQSSEQVEWQSLVESHGSSYVVCHGLVEFISSVCAYLNINPQPYLEKALNLYPIYK